MSASEDRLSGSGPEPFEACPDGGRCWHGCPLIEGEPEGKGMPCWRVLHAAPFSAHGDGWTDDERITHDAAAGLICGATNEETGERCTLDEEDHAAGHAWIARAKAEQWRAERGL